MYPCLTQETALRSFIIEQLLLTKKRARETSSFYSSLSESNNFRDDITHLREECKTKNCFIQTLLENQKVIQNTVRSGRFDKNTIIHTEPFILPKKFTSNIRTTLTKHISTSNSFELLSENSENVLDLIMFCQQKSTIPSNITKIRIEKAPSK